MKTMKPTPEVIQALETAVQLESDGYTFYQAALEQVTSPAARRMFYTLARDEKLHREMFEHVRDTMLARGEWLSLAEIQALVPRRELPDIFPAVDSSTEGEPLTLPDDRLSVLRQAIRFEEESVALYTRLKEQTTDPDGKAMYTYLIDQEETHRTILQGEYDYLAGTGFWFDIPEFDLNG